MKVFKNKFGNWTTLFQNHMLNGETIKYYMSVQFQKGQEPLKDSIDIELKRWWGSCFMAKDGNTKPMLFIADWRELEVKVEDKKDIKIEEVKADEEFDNGGFDFINQEELPFY